MKKLVETLGRKGWMLSNQLVILGKGIIKQVILPSRYQKGNVLTSILLLFLGLIALLVQFPWNCSVDFIKRWKHYNRFNCLFKKGILITGCFLFLLSSFEWSYASGSNEQVVVTQLKQQDRPSGGTNSFCHYLILQQYVCRNDRESGDSIQPSYKLRRLHFSIVPIYLLHNNLRI